MNEINERDKAKCFRMVELFTKIGFGVGFAVGFMIGIVVAIIAVIAATSH